MAVNTAILGKGVQFPFRFNLETLSKQGVSRSSGQDHVIEGIRQLLATQIGERVMRRDFGSRLFDIPFEPNDESARALAQFFVVEAMQTFEKRVEILGALVVQRDTTLEILIRVRFIQTQEIGNLVFPFFLNDLGVPTVGEGQVVGVFGTGA